MEALQDSPDLSSGPVQSCNSPVEHRFLIGLNRSTSGLLPDCDRKYVSVRTMPSELSVLRGKPTMVKLSNAAPICGPWRSVIIFISLPFSSTNRPGPAWYQCDIITIFLQMKGIVVCTYLMSLLYFFSCQQTYFTSTYLLTSYFTPIIPSSIQASPINIHDSLFEAFFWVKRDLGLLDAFRHYNSLYGLGY